MNAFRIAIVAMLAAAAASPARAQTPVDTIPRRDTALVRDTISAPAPDGVRVCAGGDVTLGNNLDPAWARMAAARLVRDWGRSAAPDSLLRPLAPLVADADIVLLNVESAIGEGPAPRKCGAGSTSCFAFRSPTSAAAALRNVAPDAQVVGNIANNHARDAGPAGFRATHRHLERAGVHVTGADTLATPVVTASGDTVAFLGFYTSAESPDARDLAAVRRHVRRAADRWPLVVVTAHIGGEGAGAQRTRDATEIFLGTINRGNPVAFARTAMDAGASAVFNHGPHVLRAAEWRNGRVAFHSLGNLLTYGPFGNREPNNRGAIACATLLPDRTVSDVDLRATRQLAPGVLVQDESRRAVTLVDSLGSVDRPASAVRFQVDGRAIAPADTTQTKEPASRRRRLR